MKETDWYNICVETSRGCCFLILCLSFESKQNYRIPNVFGIIERSYKRLRKIRNWKQLKKNIGRQLLLPG